MPIGRGGLTPLGPGYYMPAEWEKHDATWLAWPHDPETFPDRVGKVEDVYIEIIKAIHESEDVNLFAKDEHMKEKVENILGKNDVDLEKIHFIIFDYADVWIRDYGPIFVTDRDKRSLAMTHWIFNAWGEKYEGLKRDTRIPSFINERMQLIYFNTGIVLEGGSIDVNGKGTLLTTEQCLLNKNRNPHLNKNDIENHLKDYLGVNHIIWLKKGIEGDDTDGHVDDIARFVNPDTIICAYEENNNDGNYPILNENYEVLLESRDQNGDHFNIVKLPMPGFVGDENERLPASYANFYIGNKAVLVPVFGHQNDSRALDIIQNFFKDRKVIGINCADLVYGLGAIHCISQQQPALGKS